MFWDSDGIGPQETEVGWFCQWKKGGGGGAPTSCSSGARPYAREQAMGRADAPGQNVTVCTLAATTCPALLQHRSSCGRFGEGEGSFLVEDIFDDDPRLPANVTKDDISPDSSVCGVGGECVPKNEDDGAYQCTVECAQVDSRDCPKGAFACGGSPPGIAGVCSI
jgi:hypothetical protein